MGVYTKSEQLLKDVCRLLHEAREPLGFNEILAGLRKEREDQGKRLVSSETLSEGLKRLQEAEFLKRDLRIRKYILTDLGKMSIQNPLISVKVKPARGLVTDQKDIVNFLADAYVRALESGGGKRIVLPASVVQQITDKMKQFANEKTSAIQKLWTDITDNFQVELSSFLPAFMLMHVSYAASVPREDTAVMIEKAVALWARFRLDQLQHTLSSYLSHPEVLAAIDKAIRKGRFTANLASTPFEQVYSTLKRQKYL